MCKRGKGNVRDRFRNLQQEQTIENQDNMSLMGRKILHIQKQIMITTMTMMEQISRSTSTCTTEAGVGCSCSAESIRRVLLLAKSSTSIAKSWRRNQQVEKLVEIEFRSVMHAIIIAIHRHHNRRKKHPPSTPSRGEGTSRRQRAPIISRLKASPRIYITQVPISKREKQKVKIYKKKQGKKEKERKKGIINISEREAKYSRELAKRTCTSRLAKPRSSAKHARTSISSLIIVIRPKSKASTRATTGPSSKHLWSVAGSRLCWWVDDHEPRTLCV
jgi:hypothetical protein